MLPLILAGPVVRRSSSESISIWLATSQAVSLKAEAYIQVIGGQAGRLFAVGLGATSAEIRLGEHLYCQIIEIIPKTHAGFPIGQIILYDIGTSTKRSNRGLPSQLSSILQGDVHERICFPKQLLPSVKIARDDLMAMKLLYGSCRKMGGAGEDPMIAAHTRLEEYLNAPHLRPTTLVLTGDQIYADDVPDTAFEYFIQLASEIGGNLLDNPLGPRSPDFSTYQTRGRLVENRVLSRNLTGFSVNLFEGGNHLISFHEFAASYLLAWNPSLWGGKEGFLQKIQKGAKNKGWGTAKAEAKRQECNRLLVFFESTKLLSRIFANISTYMFFDDHEVTDDWNLTIEWQRTVRGMPLGSDIVRNATIAYWVFQDWGNREKPIKDPLLVPAREYFSNQRRKKAPLDKIIEERTWSFISSTTPGIVFLDTRTKRTKSEIERIRSLDENGDVISPSPSDTLLVSNTELNKLLEQIHESHVRAMVIVTPAPVFSITGIEDIKSKLARIKLPLGGLASLGTEFSDAEHWLANPLSLVNGCNFLGKLAERRLFIISGDVHFSFSLEAKIRLADTNDFDVAQLTSSALMNEHPPDRKAILDLYGVRWGTAKNSFSFWTTAGSPEINLFSDFLVRKEEYDRAKLRLGSPILEIRTHIESLHEPPPEIPLIETRNTVGLLSFINHTAENHLFSVSKGRIIRSRTVSYLVDPKHP